MSSPTKIRHSTKCLSKIKNKMKNKLSQMRQLVFVQVRKTPPSTPLMPRMTALDGFLVH